MELTSDSFEDGSPIPTEFALARPDPDTRVTLSGNLSPHLAWSGVPEGTRSFAITVIDFDVPGSGEDVNREDREVPADLPRVGFTHWLLADLPASVTEIAAGEYSDGVTAGGKDAGNGPHGTRQGVNDFTGWFAGDPEMGGTYLGYDGPAPPWNDSLVHHYNFTVHALDVESTGLEGGFTLEQFEDAVSGHILDSATMVGSYTQNPRLR